MTGRLIIGRGLSLDRSLIEERFVTADGPGGQNVNKVATAVELRVDIASAGFPVDFLHRLQILAGRRLTGDGTLVLQAREYRSQDRNRAAAEARLLDLLQRAAVRPVRRIPTKPSLSATRERVESKLRRSTIKAGRGRVDDG